MIRCIVNIRLHITTETWKFLVQVLIISRLDYCNALVTRTRKRKQLTPVFATVTPGSGEIQVIVQDSAPQVYLIGLVQKHRPVRLLRFVFGSLLSVRRTNTTAGDPLVRLLHICG